MSTTYSTTYPRLDLPEPVDIEAEYDKWLDEMYNDELPGSLAGCSYSRILKDQMPTDYRCGHVDWLDSELRDGRHARFVEFGNEIYDRAEFVEAVEDAISTIDDEISEASNDESLTEEEIDVTVARLEAEKETYEGLI